MEAVFLFVKRIFLCVKISLYNRSTMEKKSHNKSGVSQILVALLIVVVAIQSYYLYDLRKAVKANEDYLLNEPKIGISDYAQSGDDGAGQNTEAESSEEEASTSASSSAPMAKQKPLRVPSQVALRNGYWDPFADMSRMQEEMRRSLDHAFGRWEDRLEDRFGVWVESQVNVEEFEDEVVVTAEIPNIKEDSLKIDLRKNRLSLSGQAEENNEEKNEAGEVTFSQSSSRSFSYTVVLPGELDPSTMEKKLDGNLLEITVQKVNREKAE